MHRHSIIFESKKIFLADTKQPLKIIIIKIEVYLFFYRIETGAYMPICLELFVIYVNLYMCKDFFYRYAVLWIIVIYIISVLIKGCLAHHFDQKRFCAV